MFKIIVIENVIKNNMFNDFVIFFGWMVVFFVFLFFICSIFWINFGNFIFVFLWCILFIIIIVNIIKLLNIMLNNNLVIKLEIFGVMGNLFRIMVRKIIIVMRILIENLIFLFEFIGKMKIKIWRRFI